MQQSQRVICNHALEFAVQAANKSRQPLLVLFVLTDSYPQANWRHYAFMLEGLLEVEKALSDRRIGFRIAVGDPAQVALNAAEEASTLICDRGYMRHQRQWRRQVALNAPCPVIEVESDVLVPVEVASNKAEYAARTIRPKIQRQLPHYLEPLGVLPLRKSDMDLSEPMDSEKLISGLSIDRRIKPVSRLIRGGYSQARSRLDAFLENHLQSYDHQRNRPEKRGTSLMSPYLHFGQIAALEIALAVQKCDAPNDAKAVFLEELIVRRELAVNYVFYCPDYDSYNGLPDWARRTLAEHRQDPREPSYTVSQLDSAGTADPYWNAAMLEMKHTGYLHPYMRMYWGKKILQWCPDPADAYQVVVSLNNKYLLDGRDPNSYAGVGWVFGLHDQPWKERKISGKTRYMARKGLERKFDMQAYIASVQRRVGKNFDL